MRLTEEQVTGIDAFEGGADLRLFAFAGSGKTTTLAAMADEARGPGLYIAFNRAIAADARATFPPSTACATVHALAFRALRDEYGSGKLTGGLPLADLVDILRLRPRAHGGVVLAARAQALLVRETLVRFLQGSAEEPSAGDVALTGALAQAPAGQCIELIGDTVRQAGGLWQEMRDPCNPVPLGHDGYLKLWALGRPQLPVDHIFLDEAQDTTPLVLGLLRGQSAQLVAVGDPYQRIYAWRGAVDWMTASTTGSTAHLTRSFRFGHAIATAANAVIAALGEPRRVVGNPAVASRLGRCVPDAIIARTNIGVVDAVLDVLTIGERPFVVGGTAELQRLLAGVAALRDGAGSLAPELAGFASWADVQAAGGEARSGLRTLVALVESHGEDRLMAALARTAPDEIGADIVVTTAHRAKGREWDRVQLRDDFVSSAVDPAEARLFYVALTRARRAVDVPEYLLDGLGLDVAA